MATKPNKVPVMPKPFKGLSTDDQEIFIQYERFPACNNAQLFAMGGCEPKIYSINLGCAQLKSNFGVCKPYSTFTIGERNRRGQICHVSYDFKSFLKFLQC